MVKISFHWFSETVQKIQSHLRFKSGLNHKKIQSQENTLILIQQFCFSTLIYLLVPDINISTHMLLYLQCLSETLDKLQDFSLMHYVFVHCGNKQISVSLCRLCICVFSVFSWESFSYHYALSSSSWFLYQHGLFLYLSRSSILSKEKWNLLLAGGGTVSISLNYTCPLQTLII